MTFIKCCAWIVALEYFLKQNHYFGWNPHPRSDAEVLADGMTLILVALALLITMIPQGDDR